MTDATACGTCPTDLRVALVHDWLTGMRGGEKCLEVMAEIVPQAHLYTLLHVPGSGVAGHREPPHRHLVRAAAAPAPSANYRWACRFFPRAIESFDLSGYDLVLSSSHCVAKSAIPAPGALSVCYCYTPMRYVWDRFDDYFGTRPAPLRSLIGWQAARLCAWVRRTAARVHQWLPISTVVQQRLRDWYGVADARSAHRLPAGGRGPLRGAGRLPAPAGLASGGYDLVLSALVPYKRIDLAVRGAVAAGRTLVVAGKGPERGSPARLAAATRRVRTRCIFAGRGRRCGAAGALRPLPGLRVSGTGGFRDHAARGDGRRPAGGGLPRRRGAGHGARGAQRRLLHRADHGRPRRRPGRSAPRRRLGRGGHGRPRRRPSTASVSAPS